MNYKRIKYLQRLALNKIISFILFRLYVKNNETILLDITNNFKHRNIKHKENIQKNFSHLMVHYPEFAFIFFKRAGLNSSFLKSFYKSENFYCKIFGSTKLAGGVVAYHPFATVINAQKIGVNFVFRNSITIGNKNNDNTLIPIIGNNVEIGANAVIIGKIIIGDNVLIGAGTIVTKDIPSDVIAYGNPLIVKKRIYV